MQSYQIFKTKQQLFKEGVKLLEDFCILNNIQRPIIREKAFGNNAGMYYSGVLHINLSRCTQMTMGKPIRKWSYPGYKVDKTAYGVINHEFGHYLDNLFGIVNYFKNLKKREKPLTGYCPNLFEFLAEHLRLFMTNPDLLKKGRPQTYSILVGVFRLKPIEKRKWKEVLKDAHPDFIKACINFINNK